MKFNFNYFKMFFFAIIAIAFQYSCEKNSDLVLDITDSINQQEKKQVLDEEPDQSPSTLNDVIHWQSLFDEKWSKERNDAILKSKSGNLKQEFYWLAYSIDGLIGIWQATGDNNYLDEALMLIQNTINDAQPSKIEARAKHRYLAWPDKNGWEYSLWDSYYWRFVATLVRIMHQSPNLLAIKKYQGKYESLLAFSEKHIWERYSDNPYHFYRSNTHMSSHWARISMELYLVTGKDRYKKVFDNISYGIMGDGQPSNFKEQLKDHPTIPNAYTWKVDWVPSNAIQDTSHAGAIVSWWVLAYQNSMYWNKEHIEKLLNTYKHIIWPQENELKHTKYVDGSGGTNYGNVWPHEWLVLGRFDQGLQNKIKRHYTLDNYLVNYHGSQAFGLAALNAKILAEGHPLYPEQYGK